jgi:hypothetical protein
MGDAVRCGWRRCGGVYTPSTPLPCLPSPSGWKVRACGRGGGFVVDGEGSLEKRRIRPPQRLDTEEVRKVEELGEAVPGGVTVPGEEAGERSESGKWRERRGRVVLEA